MSNRKDTMQAERGCYLIRGGQVLSMDPAIGDLVGGDVLVRDGVIVDIGQGLQAPDAEIIDARDTIVMPGFVEVHWHMWNSIWRGLSHDAATYFALHRTGPSYTPADHYAAVRYAATEAVAAGITTCHNWANGIGSRADAEAQAMALVDSGIRSRFGYGSLLPPTDPVTRAEDLAAMRDWIDAHGGGLLDLGMVSQHLDSFESDVTLSRAMGLKTIGPHVNLSQVLHLLGPDIIFTHGPGAPDALLELLAAKGVKIGLCPSTDPLIGAGMPPLMRFLSAGIPFTSIGFSVDVTCQTCVDPFAAMRTIMQSARIAQQNGASFEQIIFTPARSDDPTNGLMMPRAMLELATINGARVLGLEDTIGSLTPGKRADIVLVRTSDINMLALPDTNPSFQLVQHGQPANVDTVLVDGRILKRHGRLVGVDPAAVARAAAQAQKNIRAATRLAAVDAAL